MLSNLQRYKASSIVALKLNAKVIGLMNEYDLHFYNICIHLCHLIALEFPLLRLHAEIAYIYLFTSPGASSHRAK